MIDGHRFASQAEGRRYQQLCALEDHGVITDLELQPVYPLEINGVKVGKYVGDFRYVELATGETIVEDVKGYRTALYKLKRRLVRALHGVDIMETSA